MTIDKEEFDIPLDPDEPFIIEINKEIMDDFHDFTESTSDDIDNIAPVIAAQIHIERILRQRIVSRIDQTFKDAKGSLLVNKRAKFDQLINISRAIGITDNVTHTFLRNLQKLRNEIAHKHKADQIPKNLKKSEQEQFLEEYYVFDSERVNKIVNAHPILRSLSKTDVFPQGDSAYIERMVTSIRIIYTMLSLGAHKQPNIHELSGVAFEKATIKSLDSDHPIMCTNTDTVIAADTKENRELYAKYESNA